MRPLKLWSLGMLGIALAGCTDLGSPVITPVEHGNFVLYVTNQSVNVPLVDVEVYIDGRLAVNQGFETHSGHTFIRFEYNIEAGTHTIRVRSKYVPEFQSKDFTLSTTPFVVVAFWSSPGDASHFEIDFFASQPSWE